MFTSRTLLAGLIPVMVLGSTGEGPDTEEYLEVFSVEDVVSNRPSRPWDQANGQVPPAAVSYPPSRPRITPAVSYPPSRPRITPAVSNAPPRPRMTADAMYQRLDGMFDKVHQFRNLQAPPSIAGPLAKVRQLRIKLVDPGRPLQELPARPAAHEVSAQLRELNAAAEHLSAQLSKTQQLLTPDVLAKVQEELRVAYRKLDEVRIKNARRLPSGGMRELDQANKHDAEADRLHSLLEKNEEGAVVAFEDEKLQTARRLQRLKEEFGLPQTAGRSMTSLGLPEIAGLPAMDPLPGMADLPETAGLTGNPQPSWNSLRRRRLTQRLHRLQQQGGANRAN